MQDLAEDQLVEWKRVIQAGQPARHGLGKTEVHLIAAEKVP